MRHLGYLLIGASGLFLSACLDKGEVKEGDTEAIIIPIEEAQPRDPDSFACDPFDSDSTEQQSLSQGLVGELYYLEDGQPHYDRTQDYFDYGVKVDNINVFLNQLFIPTRPFDRGFNTQAGETIKTLAGNTLYEWFAFKFRGQLQLGPDQAPGEYQVALLADDGATLRVDLNGDGQMQLIVDNDGNHPTRMACATTAISLQPGQKLNFELDYHQGPRYHIALIPLWRLWPETPSEERDPLCGQMGNSLFFNSHKNPSEPQKPYIDLVKRGWLPLGPQNYSLPEEEETNPCNEPAPVISDFSIDDIQSNSLLLTWTTDRSATSQGIYTNVVTEESFETDVSMEYVTEHSLRITGLQANTLYSVKARSSSSSGKSSESDEISVKTRR